MSAKAIHRCRITWPNGAYIELENSRGVPAEETLSEAFPLAGALLSFTEEVCPVELASSPQPGICLRDEADTLFRPLQIREETRYYVDIGVPAGRETALELASQSQSWPLDGRLAKAFERDPSRRWKSQDGNFIVTGTLNIGSYAGVISLGVQGFGESIEAEVVCRKLNYFSEFKALLDEIAEQLAELLLQQESPASIEFRNSDDEAKSNAGALVLLRHLMKPDNLPLALEKIASRPKTRFSSRIYATEHPDSSFLAVDRLVDAFGHGELGRTSLFPKKFRGVAPVQFPVEVFDDEFDTPENRYVLHTLKEIRELVYRLEGDLVRRRRLFVATECRSWLDQIDDCLSHPLWRGVGQMRSVPASSQVLQRADGYREVLRADLYLKLGLSLDWDRSIAVSEAMLGDIRPVSELYEYWCFLSLRHLLSELCIRSTDSPGNLVIVQSSGFELNLRRGTKSKTHFTYRATSGDELNVTLFYNRVFRRPESSSRGWDGSYSSEFHPDFSLLIRSDRSHKGHWIHFDAKYRATTASIRRAFMDTSFENLREQHEDEQIYAMEMRRTHRRDDLFKMHTYRDGILGSRGAFILFPGSAGDESGKVTFLRHPSAFDGVTGAIPSVGAFPLTPQSTAAQRLSLQGFLKDAFDALVGFSDYQEERGLPEPSPPVASDA